MNRDAPFATLFRYFLWQLRSRLSSGQIAWKWVDDSLFGETGSVLVVNVVMLDDVLENASHMAIKIDVERFDGKVLQGAENMLKKPSLFTSAPTFVIATST